MRHHRLWLAGRLLSAISRGQRFPTGFIAAGIMGLAVLAALGVALVLVVF